MKPIYVPGCGLANGHQAWFQGKAAGHLLVCMVRKLIPDVTNWLLFIGETEIVSDFGHSEDDGLIFVDDSIFIGYSLKCQEKQSFGR